MAPAGPEMRWLQGDRATSAGMTVAMILDRGDAARVAAVCLSCIPYLGMRFEYVGTAWEITHAEDHLRGWVAEPLPRLGVALRSRPGVTSGCSGNGRARAACSHA